MFADVLWGIWVLAIFSDIFAEALLIWGFWRQSQKSWVGIYWSAVAAGCLFESFSSLIAELAAAGWAAPSSGFPVLMRMIGRTVKSAVFWAMAIRLLRELKGDAA